MESVGVGIASAVQRTEPIRGAPEAEAGRREADGKRDREDEGSRLRNVAVLRARSRCMQPMLLRAER